MQQHAAQYLIIGNGCLATHLQQYFSLKKLPVSNWYRSQPISSLNEAIAEATHILIAISDHAIESFIADNLQHSSAIKIHFSGALVTDKACGAHPLMTFTHHLYTLEKYQAIPFIIDDDAPDFHDLFPGLSNPHTRLDKSLKPKYHAWCVMSGNFSCMLWQNFFDTLQNEFAIPVSFAKTFLQQQTQNLLTSPQTALTGPFVRNDHLTINKNIAALENDNFQEIYKSFFNCYQNMKQEMP